MSLVTYPDSDDNEENSNDVPSTNAPASVSTSVKRKCEALASSLPPLPASFQDLYATNVRTATKDDPNLHGGRKRQVAHVEGHWPTHVYLEWYPKADETRLLQKMITRIPGSLTKVHSLLQSDLGVALPLHISLSRTLSLQTKEREDFLARLKASVKDAGINAFDIVFDRVGWYPNHERNRWFLSLGAAKPNGDELNRLLQASNDVCHATKQPELYVPVKDDFETSKLQSKKQKVASSASSALPDCSDSFHVSLAWSLDAALTGGDGTLAPEELQTLSANFDCVKVKIGNSITSLPLKAGRVLQ
jgi:hypothetical protein